MSFAKAIKRESSTRTKLRAVAILSLILRGFLRVLRWPNQLVLKRQNFLWQLDAAEAIDCCLILTGGYEPDVTKMLKREIKNGDVVVDIGANMGAHTLPMAKLVGEEGQVYAIEATAFALEKLKRNIELNPTIKNRIHCHHLFLTDGTSNTVDSVSASWNIALAITHPERNKLDGGLARPLNGAGVMTFDQWASEQKLSRLDVLKLDVDGNEVQILRGALETLKKFKPRILMEWSPIHYEGRNESFQEQVNILRTIGYRFFDQDQRPIESSAEELERLIPRGVLVNVLGVMA